MRPGIRRQRTAGCEENPGATKWLSQDRRFFPQEEGESSDLQDIPTAIKAVGLRAAKGLPPISETPGYHRGSLVGRSGWGLSRLPLP
jgi:hypothetical protein